MILNPYNFEFIMKRRFSLFLILLPGLLAQPVHLLYFLSELTVSGIY